eukprot:4693074-Pleurochrysis_carterae.AAC.1
MSKIASFSTPPMKTRKHRVPYFLHKASQPAETWGLKKTFPSSGTSSVSVNNVIVSLAQTSYNNQQFASYFPGEALTSENLPP